MEIQRFDALARQLSQGETRRRLLGLFGGTALGGLVAVGLAHDADAKKKRKKKRKKKKRKPTTPTCPDDRICEQSELCCPEPVQTILGDMRACQIDDQLRFCGCTAGSEVCTFAGGESTTCCSASETCDPDDGCVAP